MAVLKDLIVHGPSNFIGTTQFTNLKANKIKATEGIFNKLIATTADFDTMTANNATVVGLLDVKGELHTNSWTNSNIATIEGSFYITPTVSCASGTFNYDGTNITLTAASGNSFAISSLYINSGDAGGTTAAWTAYSEVLITGQVAVGNEKVPLGTIKGKITSTAPTTSKIIINSLTDGKGGTSNVLASIGTGSKTFYDVKVSMLKRGNTSDVSKALPIGIFMTAMGQNGRTFIDIYGGHNAASTAVGGGLAKPVLRIGNLNGMPAIGGITPAGYGIYTSNGYFTGTIISTSGKIGNWSITSSSIQTGAFNTANTMYFGTSGISLGTAFKVTAAGALTATGATIGGTITTSNITATGGTIGGWKISADYLYKQTAAATAVNGIQYEAGLHGTNGTPSTGTTAFYIAQRTCTAYSSNTPTYGSWSYPFRVNYDGSITAIKGAIGGWSISGTSISKASAVTSGTATTQYQTLLNAPATINNDTVGLYFRNRSYNGSTYGSWVTNCYIRYDGYIYAIGGGRIGAWTINTGTGGALRNNKASLTDANSGVWIGSDGIALGASSVFKVTSAGALTATSATITGTVNATTGTFGNASAKITLGTGSTGHSAIRYGMTTLADTTHTGFYIGTDGIALGKGAFKVTAAGALTATSGSIGGSVTIGGTAASTVLTNITTAQTTANTAKTNAAAAQTTANTANTNATNAAKTATNYITNIDSNNGITIKAINGTTNTNATTGNYIKLNADGLNIYQGGVSVAEYGATARIGQEDGYRILISPDGLQMTDNIGSDSFSMSPSGNQIASKKVVNTKIYKNKTKTFSADIANATVQFTVTEYGLTSQQVSKTNSQLAVGSSFTLSNMVIKRTAASTFSAKYSGSKSYARIDVTWSSTSAETAKLNFTGANTLLWSGAYYMTETQTATLAEPVSAQLNGIVLAWSAWVSGAAQDKEWQYTFVPKNHVLLHEGQGVQGGPFATNGFGEVGNKYVYVYNDYIKGFDSNTKSSSGSSISYNNAHWVLRYVYGV